MRSVLMTIAGCAVLAAAVPAQAAIVVPSTMVSPVAEPGAAGPTPLLQKVWWDRWHHWHRWHHHHWHHYPR